MPRTNFFLTLCLFSSTMVLGSGHSGSCSAQAPTVTLGMEEPSKAPNTSPDIGKYPWPDPPATQLAVGPGKYSAFPSVKARRKEFMSGLIGSAAFIDPGIQAAFDQVQSLKTGYPSDGYSSPGLHPAHGAVPEWGEGFSGYSKRYASRAGMGLIGTVSRYGLGELLHQDVSYHRCRCTGSFPRVYHALTQSFVAHTESGRAIPSLPALVSPYFAAAIATAAWYPARYGADDALRTSSALYLGLPIKNVINEFKRSR